MKKLFSVLLTVSLVAACFTFAGVTVSAASGNLVTGDSADFEGGTVGDWASIWGSATRENVASLGVDGSKAMKLSRTANWCGAYLDLTDEIVASGIGTYTFTLQMKAADAASAGTEQAQICFGDANNGAAGKPSEAAVTADGWVTVTYTFEVTDATSGALAVTYDNWGTPEAKTGVEKVSVKVQPAAVADGATNTVLVDNVTLVNGNAVAPSDSPTPTTTTTPDEGSLEAPACPANNLINGDSSDFSASAGTWTGTGYWNGPTLAAADGRLIISNRSSRLSTPMLDLLPYILENGEGKYTVTVPVLASEEADGDPIMLKLFRENADNDAFGICDDIYGANSDKKTVSADAWTSLTYTFTVSAVDTANGTADVAGTAGVKNVFLAMECTDSESFDAVAHGDLFLDNVSLVKETAEEGGADTPALPEAPACLKNNILSGDTAEFASSLGNWRPAGYWNAPQITNQDGKMLISGRSSRLSTPLLNMIDHVLAKGAGTYTVALNVMAADDTANGDPLQLLLYRENADGDAWDIVDNIDKANGSSQTVSNTKWTTLSMTFTVDKVDTAARTIEMNGVSGITDLYLGMLCTDSESFDAVAHGNLLVDNVSLVFGKVSVQSTGDATVAILGALSLTAAIGAAWVELSRRRAEA